VAPAHWQGIVDGLGDSLRGGNFEHGLSAAVAEVDRLLREHFTLEAGEHNPNELADRPHVQ
jgi:uncharacterized membrane protein